MKIDELKLPRYRTQMESIYARTLAPFATAYPKEDSRMYPEKVSATENRASFQRDRDRIIHCTAFRRLMYKTQVFVNHEGDHFRTRLTHTLEVAQLSRGICKSLALNEELAEAIALGHDLGHTPFGHAVERYLDEELERRKEGHFFHNEQSVRIVDFIERRCKEYKGLNLTYEVREGILKHNTDRSNDFYKNLCPSEVCSTLEGQVVGLADTIAYICHDLQDAIQSGLVEKAIFTNSDFQSDIIQIKELVQNFLPNTKVDFSRFSDTYFIDQLIHYLIESVVEQSVINLIQHNIESLEDVQQLAKKGIVLIQLKEMDENNFKRIKKLVYKSIYGINTIQIMDSKAILVVSTLFNTFLEKPALLPPKELYQCNHFGEISGYDGAKDSKIRVICDYISCMTDRSAIEEYERLTDPKLKI